MGTTPERPGGGAATAAGHEADDGRALLPLTDEECWVLLAGQVVGRLGVNAEHYPLILPVNYALAGRVLVLRTGPASTLAAARSANVSFEVDGFDAVARTGWSVLVRGLAEEVTDRHAQELVAATHAADSLPWVPGERQVWLRLIPHRVTGRVLRGGDLPPVCEDAGYL